MIKFTKYSLYLAVAILSVYLLVYFIRFRYILYLAQNPVIVQVNQELGKGPLLKYIAAGDSTVQGRGASVVEKTYPYKIAEYLAQDHTVEYKNIGVSGARLRDLKEKQLPTIIAYQPDIITISIGGNDIDRLASKDYVLENLNFIISELNTKTQAKIYIANLPNFTGAQLLPYPYIWLIEKRSAPINRAIIALESDRIKIANVHDFFAAHAKIESTYSADYFHPNDYGYELWTAAFLEKMKDLQ